MTLTHWLLLLAVLGTAGCAAGMTQAELEADTRDSLSVQQTHPKMFARPNTTVGAMRVDLRECGNRPDGVYTAYRKYNGGLGSGGDAGAQAADFFSLGTVGMVEKNKAMERTTACMQDKGYARGGTP
jgi:hypothetical protein